MKYFVMFDFEHDVFSVLSKVPVITASLYCGPFSSQSEAETKAKQLNDRLEAGKPE